MVNSLESFNTGADRPPPSTIIEFRNSDTESSKKVKFGSTSFP